MKKLIYAILIALIVLAVPLFIRYQFYDKMPAGEQAYYHLRAANASGTDNSAFYEKPFFKTTYHYLINYVNPIFLQLALGLLSVILFYLTLNKLGFKNESFYMLLVLALSPIFIWTFSVLSPHSLAVFLLLLGSWLFVQENKIVSALSLVPFLAVSYNFFNSFLVAVILGSYYLVKKEKFYHAAIISAITIATSIYLRNPFMISYEILGKTNFIERLLSDFGGIWGFSIFGLILFLAGIVSFGRKKLYSYPLLLFFTIAFFIKPETAIYSNFLISFFAGIGLIKITKIRWKVNLIKDLMVVLLICGLLFSGISYIKVLSSSRPDKSMAEAMNWLSKRKDAVVFSHYSNGFIIEELGNKKVLMDSMSVYGSGFEELLNDSETVFYSRNLEKTEKILKNYNITYILIDKRMKDIVWEGKEDGLLFLLTNPQVFEKAHSNENVNVWRYVK